MSNRRRPRRDIPLNATGPARPAAGLQQLPPVLHHIEWTDTPAATYSARTLEWIAASADTARRLNVWECETCATRVLCFDRHPGTTPMMVAHSTLGGGDCPGLCRSHFYSGLSARVERDTQGGPTHEWYRPSRHELDREPARVRQHVAQGGLLVREVEQEPRPRGRLLLVDQVADPSAPTAAELKAATQIGVTR